MAEPSQQSNWGFSSLPDTGRYGKGVSSISTWLSAGELGPQPQAGVLGDEPSAATLPVPTAQVAPEPCFSVSQPQAVPLGSFMGVAPGGLLPR